VDLAPDVPVDLAASSTDSTEARVRANEQSIAMLKGDIRALENETWDEEDVAAFDTVREVYLSELGGFPECGLVDQATVSELASSTMVSPRPRRGSPSWERAASS
jgi:hypothetical protein